VVSVIAYWYCDPRLSIALPDWGDWSIDRVYQDRARDGERSQLRQLLQDCQVDGAQTLVIPSIEDLGDSLPVAVQVLQHCAAIGLAVVALKGDLPELAALDQSIALQSQQRSRRIRQGHAQNRIQALPPPGRVPYGYRRTPEKYVVDRKTAPQVKALFEQFLLFGSVRGAVRYLAQNYNQKISPSTGLRWLTSPVYRGHLAYANGDVIRDTHEALLSDDEAAQIDRLLKRNQSLPRRAASSSRSLSGLVTCQTCQSPWRVVKVAPRDRSRHPEKVYLYLRPTACTAASSCRSIDYEQILQRVIDQICRELPKAIAFAMGSIPKSNRSSPKQGIEDQILEKKKILEKLPEALISGILDESMLQMRSYQLKTEISKLENVRSQLPPENIMSIAETVSIPQFWADLSETERRFYFREFLRQVAIDCSGETWQIRLVFMF
jgi:DNA invertase Pin-like site-specific DNA recombinase